MQAVQSFISKMLVRSANAKYNLLGDKLWAE